MLSSFEMYFVLNLKAYLCVNGKMLKVNFMLQSVVSIYN